jgi:hypothetical protein
MFSPGRPKLATTPCPTGSAIDTMMMGMVEVAFFPAQIACEPWSSITSGFLAISSRTIPGSLSILPWP